jgi:hypothetical protein
MKRADILGPILPSRTNPTGDRNKYDQGTEGELIDHDPRLRHTEQWRNEHQYPKDQEEYLFPHYFIVHRVAGNRQTAG